MTGPDDPSYAEALAKLRQRYVLSLGDKADELSQAVDRYRDRPAAWERDPDAERELVHLVHRLAGTAGSFGVRDVSQCAARIEKSMMGTGMTTAELTDEIAGLIQLMRERARDV